MDPEPEQWVSGEAVGKTFWALVVWWTYCMYINTVSLHYPEICGKKQMKWQVKWFDTNMNDGGTQIFWAYSIRRGYWLDIPVTSRMANPKMFEKMDRVQWNKYVKMFHRPDSERSLYDMLSWIWK